jgi:starch phosphorylase
LHDRRVRELFRALDADAIDLDGVDPLGVLARVPQSRLDELAADRVFVARARGLLDELTAEATEPRWFARRGTSALGTVAYLSPEFGIAASLPQYSGGLGVLAGDHLKAASDLGVPLVGVGLFYRHGYFRQFLDRAGRQHERFPRLHPAAMALTPLDHVELTVELAGVDVRVRIWSATVGTVPLYLLDTFVEDPTGEDASPDQLVTDRLYGGGSEERIRQELLLGVGGFRALYQLGVRPDVFHLNEGHAGFLTLEAIRRAMRDDGLAFAEAVEAVRPSVQFTTHTPVPAGIDRFPRDLIERYLGNWCKECGLTVAELMALGAEPGGDPSMFNLAAMSLRLAGGANGVSMLHGAVSRAMFAGLWPDVPTEEVPIGSVTNGVHGPTWVASEQAELLTTHVGSDWAQLEPSGWSGVADIPDAELWRVRRARCERLVAYVRRRARTAALRRGVRESETLWCDELLDPDALTIGFARRFATYKRATLLLRDPVRLRALLLDENRPVQLVFAGKAHPADEPGKAYIQQVATFAADPDVRDRIVFVEDYDIDAGRMLTQGVDLWLNTPLRPMEACGTSGMKAALNGALNVSVLDGWWDELYRPDLGWAIPTDDTASDGDRRDAREADWLFDLLEGEIVPLFYEREGNGIAHGWLRRVRQSLAVLGPQVGATRMVRDYVETYYEPAAARAKARRVNGDASARELAAWRQRVTAAWDQLAIAAMHWPQGDLRLGAPVDVAVSVRLGSLDPDDVAVQLVAGPVEADGELRAPSLLELRPEGEPDGDGNRRFTGSVVGEQAGSIGLAVRIVPHHRDLTAWTDLGLVRWAPDERRR